MSSIFTEEINQNSWVRIKLKRFLRIIYKNMPYKGFLDKFARKLEKNLITNKLIRIRKEKKIEIALYVIFGISTTLVNILAFQGLLLGGVNYKIANLIAIIVGKFYAYITNKKFVFRSKCATILDAIWEFLRFVCFRGFTGLLDYFGLIFAVEYLGYNTIRTKYILQVIIIVLNYVFSKLIVFRKSKSNNKPELFTAER